MFIMQKDVKHFFKLIRWQGRRASAGIKWGTGDLAKMPAVYGNSMPKSGSHLIIQILEGLVELGPFIDTGMPPVNRHEDNSILPEDQIVRRIDQLRSGDIAYGYLPAREPYLSALTRPEIAMMTVFRDPRDTIVSHVFYATDMHQGHNMHKYYTENLHTMEERIHAAILGVDRPESPLTAIAKKYEAYLPWLDQKGVLSLRFEELILNREASLNGILDFLAGRGFEPKISRAEAVAHLTAAIQPKKSGTFRKGQPGNWREHFTPANIALFKEQTGDLLVRLGYEKDRDWA
jgi:hypothetical protein